MERKTCLSITDLCVQYYCGESPLIIFLTIGRGTSFFLSILVLENVK